MTFLLTELLDEESQPEHNLIYTHANFLDDLRKTYEPLSLDVLVETHSYPMPLERWVTQSDIGLIISYSNQFSPDSSFEAGWLLQAKRLFHSRSKSDKGFTVNSGFGSLDGAQHERMKRIRDWAECDFIRYLLYFPRPSSLPQHDREQLAHARLCRLGGDIFDFTLGLQLRDDLLSDSPTTAAGVFIGRLDDLPKTLLTVHESIFEKTIPFSWFIVSQLARTQGIRSHHFDDLRRGHPPENNLNNPIISGLIRGNPEIIEKDGRLRDVLGNADSMQILPAHTLTVRVIHGIDRPRGG